DQCCNLLGQDSFGRGGGRVIEHLSRQPNVRNFLAYAKCSSLSRYSAGTSSSGISCVITSATSGSLAFSTPYMAFASNALPSSANSSTLSESANAVSEICWVAPLRPAESGPVSIRCFRLRFVMFLLLCHAT